jgi:glycosyltransferase involved in cell wall biosynthesis
MLLSIDETLALSLFIFAKIRGVNDNMKVSFVATVFNEEKTIGALLDSLFKQNKMPDEIIIVDAGSSDKTLSILSGFTSEESRSLPRQVTDGTWPRHHPRWETDATASVISNFKFSREAGSSSSGQISNKKNKLKIFVRSGLTIAQGRNYGIKKATGDIIAMSDAGCILHNDWLEKITEPFEKKNADIVAGFYRMTGSCSIQKALAVYLGIPPQRFDSERFLPSARSMAFKKSLWQKIGGFNEKLDRAGEDTLFNYQAVKLGAKFARVKDALVDWEIPANFWEGLRKFFIYARGDVQAGIWWHPTQRISTHNLKIFSVFLRYLIGLVLFIFSFQYEIVGRILFAVILLYLVWPIWKMRDIVTKLEDRLWLPVVQTGSDIAVICGTTVRLLISKKRNLKNVFSDRILSKILFLSLL